MSDPVENPYAIIYDTLPDETRHDIEGSRLEVLNKSTKQKLVMFSSFNNVNGVDTSPYGIHHYAALHTTYLELETVERNLMQDPVILSSPKYYLLAALAHNLLFGLYQEIGATLAEVKDKEDET